MASGPDKAGAWPAPSDGGGPGEHDEKEYARNRCVKPQAPRANAIAERFVGTIRREFLGRILIINQRHATAVLRQYERHSNDNRPRRTLDQAAPLRRRPEHTTNEPQRVLRRDGLGGLIHEYQQVA